MVPLQMTSLSTDLCFLRPLKYQILTQVTCTCTKFVTRDVFFSFLYRGGWCMCTSLRTYFEQTKFLIQRVISIYLWIPAVSNICEHQIWTYFQIKSSLETAYMEVIGRRFWQNLQIYGHVKKQGWCIIMTDLIIIVWLNHWVLAV